MESKTITSDSGILKILMDTYTVSDNRVQYALKIYHLDVLEEIKIYVYTLTIQLID